MFRQIIKMTLLILLSQVTISAKNIVLSAKVTYENRSNKDIYPIIHRVTLPVDTSYQKLTNITTEHIKYFAWTWSNKFPKGLKKSVLKSIKAQTTWEIK